MKFTRISSACLPACLPACLFAYLCVCVCVCVPACLPACLPAIRPVSGERIGPVFSHNTEEYWHTNTGPVFQLRFIYEPRWVLSSFITSLSLWLVNEKVEIAEEVLMNCKAYINCVILTAKCMCTWLHHLLKLLATKHNVFPIYRFKSARMVSCWDIYVFLGYNIPIQLLLKLLSRHMKIDYSFHHVPIHITNYKICNILCLNK